MAGKSPTRELQRDGLEHIGAIELGRRALLADPGQVTGGRDLGLEPGPWELFVRVDREAEDEVVELIGCLQEALDEYYELYDEAGAAGHLAVESGRVALLDGSVALDGALRREMLEPEELPWVLDRAVVCAVPAGCGVHVFVAGEPARLVSLAFAGKSAFVVGKSVPESAG